MKVSVVGKNKNVVERQLRNYDIELNNRRPDIVISFGGDGTCLMSEQMYPEVPKVFIRHRSNCTRCNRHNFSRILNNLKKGNYRMVREMKIEGFVNGRKLIALNDINIHYKPPEAIRLQVKVNGKVIANELIGDGVVVSTPHGSTAYFHSITGKSFNRGIGLAFNNPTKKMKHLILNENAKIEIKILRGNGFITNDCNNNLIKINNGSIIRIRKHPKYAKLIQISGEKLKIENI